ncbi:MAG: hypothetical protein PVH23_05540 [candidate division WOR-3 bacterium]
MNRISAFFEKCAVFLDEFGDSFSHGRFKEFYRRNSNIRWTLLIIFLMLISIGLVFWGPYWGLNVGLVIGVLMIVFTPFVVTKIRKAKHTKHSDSAGDGV